MGKIGLKKCIKRYQNILKGMGIELNSKGFQDFEGTERGKKAIFLPEFDAAIIVKKMGRRRF